MESNFGFLLPPYISEALISSDHLVSIRPFMAEDNRNGAPEEHEIQPDTPVMHVPAVHLYALGVVDVAAAAGLPHAGDAGEDGVVLLDIFPISWHFCLYDRTGPYEAHLTFEDIQELRQLIEASLSEEGTALGDAGIVLQFEFSIPFFFRRRIGREEVV